MSVKPACEGILSPLVTPETVKQRVTDYYSGTNIDYHRILNATEHLGFHYGYYDAEHRDPDSAILNMNRQLALRAGIANESTVLDAGCGIGGSSIWLAKHCGASVTGITLSADQTRQARANARLHDVGKLTRFAVADYCSTPFEKECFDVVWAIESVCYAACKATFIDEAMRLLKPGGTLIIADGFRADREMGVNKETLLRDWLKGWAVDDVDTEKEMLKHCQSAGFEALQFDDITERVMPFSRHLLRLGIAWSPVTHLLRYSGLIDSIRFENSQSTIRQYRALKQNAWKYGILSARKPG